MRQKILSENFNFQVSFFNLYNQIFKINVVFEDGAKLLAVAHAL